MIFERTSPKKRHAHTRLGYIMHPLRNAEESYNRTNRRVLLFLDPCGGHNKNNLEGTAEGVGYFLREPLNGFPLGFPLKRPQKGHRASKIGRSRSQTNPTASTPGLRLIPSHSALCCPKRLFRGLKTRKRSMAPTSRAQAEMETGTWHRSHAMVATQRVVRVPR